MRIYPALRRVYSVSHSTIYALSTPPGRSAISIIRVSGPSTAKIVQRLTDSAPPAPRLATLRKLKHPKDKSLLDRALTLYFPAPNSYTGEDLAEFHVHGSTAVIRAVLDAIGSCDSYDEGRVRYAEAGEFTRRAFDNERLDLTQIEGIGKLLVAETEEQRRTAMRQAEVLPKQLKLRKGGLKTLYDGWRTDIIKCRALTEAIIDFGEDEGIEDEIYNDVHARVRKLLKAIQSHLTSSMKGSVLQTGIQTVLLGAPNAGKSSLLNILAQRPASIVSPEPGTTRDIVEVLLDIAGFPCVVGDTAGLRDGNSVGDIEREGVLRARKRAEMSDLRILIVDTSLGPENALHEVQSYYNSDNRHVSTVLVLNKVDLMDAEIADIRLRYSALTGLSEDAIFPISCLNKEGIAEFGSGMAKILENMTGSRENTLVTNERQRRLLSECISHLQAFLGDSRRDVVMGAEELKYSANALGKISGKVDPEEVLGAQYKFLQSNTAGVIFADFCIGK